jgi:hypothetical protein
MDKYVDPATWSDNEHFERNWYAFKTMILFGLVHDDDIHRFCQLLKTAKHLPNLIHVSNSKLDGYAYEALRSSPQLCRIEECVNTTLMMIEADGMIHISYRFIVVILNLSTAIQATLPLIDNKGSSLLSEIEEALYTFTLIGLPTSQKPLAEGQDNNVPPRDT